MDTSTVLEKYTQDLSNLPLEIRHLLEEIKNKDIQLQDARKRYQAKDNQIHKFIRANGTLTKHPKEQQLYSKIEEDMKVAQKLQKEKILLANTALFLISKHLFNFETDIAKLERDELLPPLENGLDLELGREDASLSLSDSYSVTPTPRNGTSTPVSMAMADIKKGHKRKTTAVRGTTSGNNLGSSSISTRPVKRLKSEEMEETMSFTPTGSLALNGHVSVGPGGHGEGPNGNGEDADNNLYCFCQRVSFGEMIGCDNDDCKYEWFHWSCVGITSPPKADEVWYCPDCAPKMEKRKKKRKIN
ncbi:chromatin modification-related protein YNG2 [Spathaspora passalidarum NRRL Y-27907]|uniref:Chromatin modification-related protein n=1 Tax=Spathaspora passalidarum (strain NRRL Y-27907 / 11-Y1) TaxID=619300 RepID=G3AMP3_SPAPN|nr:chromatin modification-related protein YNG2 [Spathaspora passalidarum NRRL Y-27907]EGW33487.1 chromatin modification-related protein YNG2 [Spathaspora passalidarum NRRL Y-27907]